MMIHDTVVGTPVPRGALPVLQENTHAPAREDTSCSRVEKEAEAEAKERSSSKVLHKERHRTSPRIESRHCRQQAEKCSRQKLSRQRQAAARSAKVVVAGGRRVRSSAAAARRRRSAAASSSSSAAAARRARSSARWRCVRAARAPCQETRETTGERRKREKAAQTWHGARPRRQRCAEVAICHSRRVTYAV